MVVTSDKYLTAIESILVDNYIITGRFDEIDTGIVNVKANKRRKIIIFLNALYCLRFALSLTLRSRSVDDIIGECFWALGISGLFMTFCIILAIVLTFSFVVAMDMSEHAGYLNFLNELRTYRSCLDQKKCIQI